MKKLLILLVLLFPVITNAGDFGMSEATDTKTTITVDDHTFNIWATKSGAKFIKQISPKTNKEYPVWIGEKHPTEPNKRISSSGKTFELLISPKGLLYSKY